MHTLVHKMSWVMTVHDMIENIEFLENAFNAVFGYIYHISLNRSIIGFQGHLGSLHSFIGPDARDAPKTKECLQTDIAKHYFITTPVEIVVAQPSHRHIHWSGGTYLKGRHGSQRPENLNKNVPC